MKPNVVQFVMEWFDQAGDDLRWAEASLKDGFYPQTCFVAQQVAEKALKGYLYGFGEERKTHSLVLLAKMAVKHDESFEELKECLETLEPAYMGSRYPDVGEIQRFQDKTLAEECVRCAREVLTFVRGRVSGD